jgi:hypothetical protein
MRGDELLFDKIEAYLRGQLPSAEAAAFEAEIAADPELAALVKMHRLERRGLEWLVERDLLTKMNVWEREAEQAVPAPKPLRATFVRRWGGVTWSVMARNALIGAAAVLTLGVFGWWMLQPQTDIGGPPSVLTAPKPKTPSTAPPKTSPKPPAPTPKPDESDRVAESPTPSKPSPVPKPETKPPSPPAPPAAPNYPALAATFYREGDFIQKNGNTTSGESPGYGEALDSYKSGKYSDVEKLLKPALKSNPEALKTKELLAHSLYQRGKYDEALTYFRQLVGVKNKAVAERSQWAMALTLLHNMPAQKALLDRTLNNIAAKPGHAFYQQALRLKNEMK